MQLRPIQPDVRGGHIIACNIFCKWASRTKTANSQQTHTWEKIKTMATTKAMATIRVMANSTEQTVANNNKDNANGYTSVEQIIDVA